MDKRTRCNFDSYNELIFSHKQLVLVTTPVSTGVFLLSEKLPAHGESNPA